MRKFTKLLLTLALLCVGVGANAEKLYADLSKLSSPDSNATWDGNTNTITWVGQSNNMVTNFDFPAGDLSSWEMIVVNVASINNAIGVRVQIKANGAEKTKPVNGTGVTSIKLSAFGFADGDLEKVEWIRMLGSGYYDGESHTINNETPASAVISQVYLYKADNLNFNDEGKASIAFSEIIASGGLSFDESTGVVTTNGQSGALTVTFASPQDLSQLSQLKVNRTGDDFFSNLNMKKADGSSVHNVNAWYSSKFELNGLGEFASRATDVKSLVWYSGGVSKGEEESDEDYAARVAGLSMTISSIVLSANVITCTMPLEEVALNTLPYHSTTSNSLVTPDWNMNKADATYYGGSSSDPTRYVDLTQCGELRIYPESKTGFRAFFFGGVMVTANSTGVSWIDDETDYWKIDLSKVSKTKNVLYLICIKGAAWDSKDKVTNITVMRTPAGSCKYVLSGHGMSTPAATAALSDAYATSIDATDITAPTALVSANPNCLFFANDGMVTNSKNVIVDGVCANLELTDAQPFKAPEAFTATNAKFTKVIGDELFGTMVIPFNATIPQSAEAFNLKGINGETILRSDAIAGITANKPVLVKNSGTHEFTAKNAPIAATGDGVLNNNLLNGGYSTMTAAADEENYVLQNSATNGVNFYWVNGTAATVKPFRAYLTASAVAARTLYLDLDNLTGIDAAIVANEAENGEVYNLAGQRVAQPQKGLYIVNGKKVIVK